MMNTQHPVRANITFKCLVGFRHIFIGNVHCNRRRASRWTLMPIQAPTICTL